MISLEKLNDLYDIQWSPTRPAPCASCLHALAVLRLRSSWASPWQLIIIRHNGAIMGASWRYWQPNPLSPRATRPLASHCLSWTDWAQIKTHNPTPLGLDSWLQYIKYRQTGIQNGGQMGLQAARDDRGEGGQLAQVEDEIFQCVSRGLTIKDFPNPRLKRNQKGEKKIEYI